MKTVIMVFSLFVGLAATAQAEKQINCEIKRSYLDQNKDTQYKTEKVNFSSGGGSLMGIVNYPDNQSPKYSIVIFANTTFSSTGNEVQIMSANGYISTIEFESKIKVEIGLPEFGNLSDDTLFCEYK